MNTKIYKEVLFLAKELMSCAHKKDQAGFDGYYQELTELCQENDGTDKDHPVQWETLGDFTDDLEEAIVIYDKALARALAINSKDYLSSVGFSAATLKKELGDTDGAIAYLEQAKIHSNKIIDKQLKAEIHDLLTSLKAI
ncbi:tetratricopeptide repeat protein [Marinomonas sp. A79]|uniref:Tetratricopeptide repeat protein n=1 Tax=Marinomonas vulgaris TaxID=2823372 RepID=A0ABS5HAG5_9GAMM|nr:tetratricopeptide repeat protein [Marinomonas vulgaris]MBR7888364.1 tetratricopeptide repeat protein [Marinomonas vulgaris]